MDERWESEIIEYGAINITGFRILDTHKRYVKEFLDGWRKLDATTSPGAGKEQISVRFGMDNDYSHNNKCNVI
jgi:glutamate receptor, ionotropic, invertebrate